VEAVAEVLPLFPLGHVLMPGCALPLRIFEPRYRALLDDVTREGARNGFGVVAITAGAEVRRHPDEPLPEFASVGTIAEILEVHPADDGTVSVLTGGSSRFRVDRMVDTDAPYLVAEVSPLPEIEGELPPELPGSALALTAEYNRLVEALTGRARTQAEPYPSDPCLLSYRLASDAPLSPEDRQVLLEDDTATARLLRVRRVLRREVVLLRRTRSVAVPFGMLRATLRP
jgi:hypothetical protein